MKVQSQCKIIDDDWGKNIANPIASWFDETQQHFVALLDKNQTSTNESTELVEYRVLEIKDNQVVPGLVIQMQLPISLANENGSRKIPLHSKLSIDQNLMAIQYSDTLIRIVPLEEEKMLRHWTIELEASGEPIYTSADNAPHPRYKAHYDSMTCKDSTILGMVWSDHGGNSQDLVIVTTKAMLCYKISLLRNQMAATHTFPHARIASSMWWEPMSRTILIGSYGPASECSNSHQMRDHSSRAVIQMRPFVLQFPKAKKSKRLPRFELPPPRRLTPFAVGLGGSAFVSQQLVPLVPDIRLVNLYGEAYVLELFCEPSQIRLYVYKVDSQKGTDVRWEYIIDGIQLSETDVTSKIVNVIDNIVSIVLRESRFVVYVDIRESEKCHIVQTWEESMDIFRRKSISCLHQNLLWDRDDGGKVVQLALDIDSLASNLRTSPVVVPFLLRRSHPDAHSRALSEFSSALTAGSSSTLRRKYIHAAVKVYSEHSDALVNDWKHSMSLIAECALLPAESRVGLFLKENTMLGTNGIDAQIESDNSVLYQREIIQMILLPMAKNAIKKSGEMDGCRDAIDIAVGLVLSLDRYRCMPCPALECLIIAMLWRIGYNQELIAFLRSRISSLDLNSRGDLPASHVDAGTVLLVSAILAIVEDVELGSGNSRVDPKTYLDLKEVLISESTRLLSCRVSDPCLLVRYLLCNGRLSAGMTNTIPLLKPADNPKKGASNPTVNFDLCFDFFRTALLWAKQADTASSCRVLLCLHSLLTRLDGEYLDKVPMQQYLNSERANSLDSDRDGTKDEVNPWELSTIFQSIHSEISDLHFTGKIEEGRSLRSMIESELKQAYNDADAVVQSQMLEIFSVEPDPEACSAANSENT